MVIMDGGILVGAERAEVIKKLSRLFGTDPENVDCMLQGEPLIIKKNLPERRAHQYFRTITNAGAACHLEDSQATVAAGYRSFQDAGHMDEDTASSLSVEHSEDTADNSETRRRTDKQVRQVDDTTEFKINDLNSSRPNDKIVLLSLIVLIFTLLAAVYFII